MTRRNPRAARPARNEPGAVADTLAPESAPASPADDRATLLRELDRIIKSDGPDPAKVSAIGLKAKLLGMSEPPPADPEGEDEIARDATPRDMARAVLAIVREYSAQLKDLLGIELVVAYPGEAVLRVKDPDLAKHVHAGAEPALTLEEHLARGSSVIDRTPVYSSDGATINCNGYTITFGELAGQGRSRPVSAWIITNAQGGACGHRLTTEEAVALAQSLPNGESK